MQLNCLRIFGIFACAGLAPHPALAGSLDEPVMTQTVVATSAVPRDWTGVYAGVQLGTADLSSDQLINSTNGNTFGFHIGYLQDMGAFVLGAELDYDVADVEYTDINTVADLGSVARLKFRAGYDGGKFLPYVTTGFASAQVGGDLEGTADGYFVGLGAEYRVSDRVRMGAELLSHKFEDVGTTTVDVDAKTFALRVSYQF